MAKYPNSDGWHTVKAAQQHGQLSGDVTDLIVYFDLSKVDSDFQAALENGGGGLRVLKGDLDTEIAREVVSWDNVAKTGEVWAKADGTNSSTADTDFWFACKDGEVDYSAGGTYGSEAVWKGVNGSAVDFSLVSHDGGLTDSTANGYGGSPHGGISGGDSVGKIGVATGFDQVGDYFSLPDINLGTVFSMSTWMNSSSSDANIKNIVMTGHNASPFELSGISFDIAGNDDVVRFLTQDGTNQSIIYSTTVVTDGSWHYINAIRNLTDFRLHVDNETLTDTSTMGTQYDNFEYPDVGQWVGGSGRMGGVLDEVRILTSSTISADWITTEYNNQDDPATFWAFSDYVAPTTGGGGGLISDVIGDVIDDPIGDSIS